MPVSAFRRTTKTETKKVGKGSRGNWRENFRPRKGVNSSFVLINGDYVDPDPDPKIVELDMQTGQPKPVIVPYYKWLKHRRKLPNKSYPLSETCSRGWDAHNPQPCAACAAMDQGDKSIGLSEAYNFGLVHLAIYHRHPLLDRKTNQVIMKKDNSGPFMVETECEGPKTCNFCQFLSGQMITLEQGESFGPYDPQTLSYVYGSRRYLEIGKGHLGNLSDWDKQVGSHCGGIAYVRDSAGNYVYDPVTKQPIAKGRCNNELTMDALVCSNCNNVLIDAEKDPRTVVQLEELAMDKYPCHYCQRPVFLKEIDSCDSCGNAVVNSIFDGVITAMRQGEDTQSHLVLTGYNIIEEFEASLPQGIRQLLQGKTLRDRIQELAKPYNFEELCKPRSLQEQAKHLELNVQPTAPTAYGAYGPPAGVQQMQPAYPQPGMPGGFTPYPAATPGTPGPAPFQAPPTPHFGK